MSIHESTAAQALGRHFVLTANRAITPSQAQREVTKDLASFDAARDQLLKELDKVRSQIDERENAAANAQQEAEEAKAQIEKLQAENDKLSGERDQMQKELEECRENSTPVPDPQV